MKHFFYHILFFVFIFCQGTAQEYTTNSRKAIRNYEDAIEAYNNNDMDKSISKLQSAIKADKKFIEAYLTLGDVYHSLGKSKKEIEAYRNGLRIDPEFYPRGYYNLGKAEFNAGMYEEASSHFKKYLELDKGRGRNIHEARRFIKSCAFALEALKNPVPFQPENLGPNINSRYDEYYPTLTADENTMIITVQLPLSNSFINSKSTMQEDFFIAHRDSTGEWKKAENIGQPLNSQQNEGAQTITTDGSVMFFTACNRRDGQGSCDLYFTFRKEGNWTQPINAGKPINTRAWESQPSISPDGNTIYFVSNRPGGFGGMDIWKSELTDEGYWGTPENLGNNINTPGDEKSPYIHFDNKTLYFSSNGHIGLGSFDLYVTSQTDSNTWKKPKNLGYPINTHSNEEGLIVNARGDKAYYSSNRQEETGEDIYSFDLYEEVRPTPASYVKGTVYDATTKEPLRARFELISINNSEVIMKSFSRKDNGEFLLSLPVNNNYALNVSKTGYLFHSENFSLDSAKGYLEPFLIDIPLNRKVLGESVVLKNVFFEFDSYKLKEESKAELDRLIDFLKANEDVMGEISGHTDNIGSLRNNQELSEKRAASVYQYLIENGISEDRISYTGYGETKPIATNKSPEGRALNRRTEFTITGKK